MSVIPRLSTSVVARIKAALRVSDEELAKASAIPAKSSAGPLKSSAGPLKSSAGPLKSSAGPLKSSAGPSKSSAGQPKTSAGPSKTSTSGTSSDQWLERQQIKRILFDKPSTSERPLDTKKKSKSARKNKKRRENRKNAVNRRLWVAEKHPRIIRYMETRIKSLDKEVKANFKMGLRHGLLAQKMEAKDKKRTTPCAPRVESRKRLENADRKASSAIRAREALKLYKEGKAYDTPAIPTESTIKTYIYRLMKFQ